MTDLRDELSGGSAYHDAGFAGLPLSRHATASAKEGVEVPVRRHLKLGNFGNDASVQSPTGVLGPLHPWMESFGSKNEWPPFEGHSVEQVHSHPFGGSQPARLQ